MKRDARTGAIWSDLMGKGTRLEWELETVGINGRLVGQVGLSLMVMGAGFCALLVCGCPLSRAEDKGVVLEGDMRVVNILRL